MSPLIIFFVLCTSMVLICETEGADLHVNKCDNFCGGSRLNPFGRSGTCKNCCLEKGFYAGGECGDFFNRHCRCVLNPQGGQPQVPQYPPQG